MSSVQCPLSKVSNGTFHSANIRMCVSIVHSVVFVVWYFGVESNWCGVFSIDLWIRIGIGFDIGKWVGENNEMWSETFNDNYNDNRQ